MSEEIFITENAGATQKIAEDLARNLRPGDFLAFYGNLGSGKTTFIQGLAKALGIKRRIISPTFIIVRTYEFKPKTKNLKFKPKTQNANTFYHIDLYRTETKEDLLGLGLDQIVNDKTSVVAVEWAEKMGLLLPDERYEIILTDLKEDKREIKIKKYE